MGNQDYLESPGQAWEDGSFHCNSCTFLLHPEIVLSALLDMSATSAQTF